MNNIGRINNTYTPERLYSLSKISPGEKIDWLDDFLDFLESAMTEEAKEIWMKFRSGELNYPNYAKIET